MARLPRYVIPGQPQHIIQRGNNRQIIFAVEADYQFFRDALVEAANKHSLSIHADVWMTNHVHLLVMPALEDSQQDFSVGGATLRAVLQLHLQT
jgi:putative transposase